MSFTLFVFAGDERSSAQVHDIGCNFIYLTIRLGFSPMGTRLLAIFFRLVGDGMLTE